MGFLATLCWLVSFRLRIFFLTGQTGKRISFLLGPVFLIALGLGQGAFPLSLAPTAWRTPLAKNFVIDTLGEVDFKFWVAERASSLGRNFDWKRYNSLTELEALSVCDRALDATLSRLGMPPGRRVHAFKDMGPITSAFGLIYGGPAFHDPFFGELAIIKNPAYPTSRNWRLSAACHEAAHAKGFTREMDAEILTQLALLFAGEKDSRFRILADIHFLRKSGMEIHWPDSLSAEGRRAREAREKTQADQQVVSFIRHWVEKANLHNKSGKYGDRAKAEPWNPRHPFFAVIRQLQIPESQP